MKRKCLTVSLILLALLFQTAWVASAEVQSAGADIPVVIDGGGTAYMTAEDNSPLPKEVSIRVGNGRTGHFYISFTEVGSYRYTIRASFSRPDGEWPADDVFRLIVTVYERNGSLYTVSVINSNSTTSKSDEVRFQETPEPSSEMPDYPPETVTFPPDQPPTKPSETSEPATIPSSTRGQSGPSDTTTTTGTPGTPGYPSNPGTPSNPDSPGTPGTPHTPRIFRIFQAPQTGDETHLMNYLLIATASSAGLFLLALLYSWNTNRLIKKDD